MQVELAFVEGELERPVAAGLLAHCEHHVPLERIISKGGGGTLWAQVARYQQVAINLQRPVFVLADLERERCAPSLLKKRLHFKPDDRLVIRIAVRMLESWLLADTTGLASFLELKAVALDAAPDELDNPKRTIVELSRRCPNRDMRNALVPSSPRALVGPGYLDAMSNFVRRFWSPKRAATTSASLSRAIAALQRLHR
ncbi:MAG: DUF4276 family protein [Myxococcaceae bacterium]|nr:DUF4276 family protein [Myxococcaceae bacterium]